LPVPERYGQSEGFVFVVLAEIDAGDRVHIEAAMKILLPIFQGGLRSARLDET
jgi:hypothetical protein